MEEITLLGNSTFIFLLKENDSTIFYGSQRETSDDEEKSKWRTKNS